MNDTPRPPSKNQILAALTDEDYQRLAPHLEEIALEHAKVLYEIGGPVDYVYFPKTRWFRWLRKC